MGVLTSHLAPQVGHFAFLQVFKIINNISRLIDDTNAMSGVEELKGSVFAIYTLFI